MRPNQPGSEKRAPRYVSLRCPVDYSSLIIGGRGQPKLEDSRSSLFGSRVLRQRKNKSTKESGPSFHLPFASRIKRKKYHLVQTWFVPVRVRGVVNADLRFAICDMIKHYEIKLMRDSRIIIYVSTHAYITNGILKEYEKNMKVIKSL